MESVQIKFTFSVYIQFIPNIFSQMINYLYISVAFCSKLLLNVYKRKIILEYTLNKKFFFKENTVCANKYEWIWRNPKLHFYTSDLINTP